MDILTNKIVNMQIDTFLKRNSNYLFETESGYVALLAEKDIRPFSMFHPFYIKPDEIRDCWLIKDIFRKWAGKIRVIAIVPSNRVNLFAQHLSNIYNRETHKASRVA